MLLHYGVQRVLLAESKSARRVGTFCPSFSKPTFVAIRGPGNRLGHKMYIRMSSADHCLRTYRFLPLGEMSHFNLPTGVVVESCQRLSLPEIMCVTAPWGRPSLVLSYVASALHIVHL